MTAVRHKANISICSAVLPFDSILSKHITTLPFLLFNHGLVTIDYWKFSRVDEFVGFVESVSFDGGDEFPPI